jgi:hypothetical protein
MTHKLTISVEDDIYKGLYDKVGGRNIGRFLSDLARPYVVQSALEDGYRAMASDRQREQEASEWAESLIHDSWNA